jgi:hypothetical protein
VGVTKRQFAMQLGLDVHHVSKAVAAGMPTRWDNRIDRAEALSWIISNAREGSRLHDAALFAIATPRARLP